MQRKEGTAGHICHTHKVRDAAMRAAGPNLPGGGGGIAVSAKQCFAGAQSGGLRGSTPIDPASSSAHVDLYAGTSPSFSVSALLIRETNRYLSRSPGAPRATPPHSETGS